MHKPSLRTNNFNNPCPTGTGTCYTCSKGSTITNYLDMNPACIQGIPGWKLDPLNDTDCGKYQTGDCMGVGACMITTTHTIDCTDPSVVISQP